MFLRDIKRKLWAEMSEDTIFNSKRQVPRNL